jgi:uncharacterized protein (TIGR02118 family)
MDSAGLPVISCVFAPSLDTPAHIELAERLGYRRAWCYDSPALCADPWMVLALAAGRTRAIGLGPASLVPSLRHPMVTAAALTTLAGLAPGRVSTAFGTGLTGRMLLGEQPMRWAEVEEYVAKLGPVGASFVKNYELVIKRPDLDQTEFDRYWAQVHGPLAATIPTIRRYVQAHLSPGTRGTGTAPYDGLAITWFDDVAAMRAGAATEAYAKTRADEANFLAGELPFVITTERTTFPRT